VGEITFDEDMKRKGYTYKRIIKRIQYIKEAQTASEPTEEYFYIDIEGEKEEL